jgi:hypothetical protein
MKRIHTASKIFFPNPIVVRLDFTEVAADMAGVELLKIRKRAYKLIYGTWGHSGLEYDSFMGSDGSYNSYARAYFCFSDEMDALQFRLTVDSRAIQVKMWPKSITFTIHEYTDEPAGPPANHTSDPF